LSGRFAKIGIPAPQVLAPFVGVSPGRRREVRDLRIGVLASSLWFALCATPGVMPPTRLFLRLWHRKVDSA